MLFRKLLTVIFALALSAAAFPQCNVEAGPDTTICPGGSVQLNPTGTPAFMYAWSPAYGLSNAYIANPVASPAYTTTYYIYTTGLSTTEMITNGNFEQGNTGFTSSYIYSPGNLWNEGTYDVITNPNSSHANFSPCTDHTTGSGKMMVINGSGVPNAVVWSTSVTVQQGFTYEFSTWLASVHSTSPAILQFSINGNVIGTPFNAASQTCLWQQFYETWYSDISTVATISIVNQNTTLSGNDFALDDISFKPYCFAYDSLTITVQTIQAEAGPDTTVCAGSPAVLSGSGGTHYQWSTGDTTQSITVNPVASMVYYLTVSDICEDVDSVTVHTIPLPVLSVSVSGDTICRGESVTLHAQGAANWFWTSSPPDPSLAGQEYMQEPVVSPAVTTVYSVTGTDTSSCSSLDSLTVTVYEIPVPSFSVSRKVICTYDTTTITFTGNYSAGTLCTWSFDGGSALGSGPGPYTVSWNTGGLKVISLSVSENGCLSATVTDTVTVLIPPSISFGAADHAGCPPLTVQFQDSSANVFPSAAYLWDFGTGVQSSLADPVYTYNLTGNYSVTLTIENLNGCSASLTLPEYVVVFPVPEADFTATPGITTMANPTVRFHDCSAGSPFTWLWDLGDGTTMNVPDFQYAYADTGTYFVNLVVMNEQGCSDTAVGKVRILPDVSIYIPNAFTPNDDGVNDFFVIRGENLRELEAYIFSRWGELVYRSTSGIVQWDGSYQGKRVPCDTYALVVYYLNAMGYTERFEGCVNVVW